MDEEELGDVINEMQTQQVSYEADSPISSKKNRNRSGFSKNTSLISSSYGANSHRYDEFTKNLKKFPLKDNLDLEFFTKMNNDDRNKFSFDLKEITNAF